MVLITKQSSGPRADRLIKSFWAVAKGEQHITNSHSARLFLQACKMFCEKNSAVKCVEVLISSSSGVPSLERAVRADLSVDFITSTTLPFILALSDPGVATLNDGRFLRQLLLAILEPSTFWTALSDVYRQRKLGDAGLEAFAWLCLQIVLDQSGSLDAHQIGVRSLTDDQYLVKSQSPEVRKIAYRIEKVISILSQPGITSNGVSPGGRHDNDFADFRKVSIYPTSDELLSTDDPYLQRLADVFDTPMDTRGQIYRDWLFRLLRDDMLSELREDLQTAMGQKKSKRRPIALGQLKLVGINDVNDSDTRASPPYAVNVACYQGIEFPRKAKGGKKKFLVDTKQFMKHDSFGALCCDGTIVAFGSIVREVDNLLKTPPVIGIRFTDDTSLQNALKVFQTPARERLRFLVVDTATFAYEPILKRLKGITELPLEPELIDADQPSQDVTMPPKLDNFLRQLRAASSNGLAIKMPASMRLKKDITLQGAQLDSFINGLSQKMALIQGPPGTGKSFLGALILVALLRLTDSRVLVLSYTNHALDQFMEDLMEIGVSADQMVRLGSKSTEATKGTLLRVYDQQKRFWLTPEERNILNGHRRESADICEELESCSKKLSGQVTQPSDILEYLEFSENFAFAWAAFQLPPSDGFQMVGANNKVLDSDDLYRYWLQNTPVNRLGGLYASLDPNARSLWHLSPKDRRELHEVWSQAVREEQIDNFVALSKRYSSIQAEIKSIRDESGRRVLREKRVIACTTTAAAMYQSIIETANPDVILVEEAGEILEAHVITAMSPSVKQVILIGDHKQLRPKVSNYKLTKEKGEGYDLNVSLFERLVCQGRHFTTLQEQHRSHPDISFYSRMLAYPELKDMPATHDRAPIRGLKSRVTFVHHEQPEDTMAEVGERRDPTAKASKRNPHEADMVLKMIKFLGQQGYKTENMVVLTPYLGQLFLLKETLSKDSDPYLNDLDSHDLVRAGLLTQAAAKVNKKSLRLSTIDNYQGEECDIVIVSLTRSNASGDIGFLYARERLVVLLSRARNGLILFGNMMTFMKSKKGGEMWTQYFDALRKNDSLFDGVPVHCERHPDTKMLLKTPKDFETMCPDGGCAEPCGTSLSCGKHTCNRRCHRVQDHSKTVCEERVDRTCSRGHKSKIRCGDKSGSCKACTKEDEDNRRRILRDRDLEKKRQEQQDRYRRELQEMDDEIDHLRRTMNYESEEKQQAEELKQKKQRLESLREREANLNKMNEAQKNSSQSSKATDNSSPPPVDAFSSAAKEWESMKQVEGAKNAALDKLMGMIGLEAVKDRLLSMKSMVDTKLRQGFSLTGERFSCSLLGNPGTGKTTVARIYAEFLTSVGAIAGSSFKEVTGSKLANIGVSGCEKLLEEIMNDGGGVMFIDEAYQLSSGNSPGGKAVLDYLLAEVENQRGKVVFVLAGYSKDMESFFFHNSGIPSRFPIEMKFEDYTDEELVRILQLQVQRKFNGRMKVEEGPDGRFFRIACRRIGNGRGKNGFGNARAVENCLQLITDRQAARIRRERKAKRTPDDLLLTREDIIGPEPSQVLKGNKAYRELNCLIGIQEVKDALKVLMDTLKTNYERELAEQPLVEFSLNKVFLGSPGTGKTTVAKLYGKILTDLGLLSNGEVVEKNPADFVGAALGQSEAQTKGILASTVGKVLVIDEAYGLYGGGSNSSASDPYKTTVVNTIVAEVQSVPGEDRCVLLLGYKDQMEEMFQNVNPGLSRRFPLSSAFVFEDFSDEDLAKILAMKLGKTGFTATDKAMEVALDILRRARNRPNFGNAGEIDILLGKAMANHQKRVSSGKVKRHGKLEAVDFDEDFDRAERGDTDVKMLFEGEVGREKLISVLQGYQNRVRQAKPLEIDPEIPFNFLFRGPPGTGKTTAARKMGKVYYDMGFLASTEVIECSATELIGQYVGQTGPKVQQLLDKALGRILFIDEAYRLASDRGSFAKEAVDELVDCVTKPKYQGKLIIILAGYVKDINSLLNINPGMSSRFPESIDFDPLTPEGCIELMTRELQAKKKKLMKKKAIDFSCLEMPRESFTEELTAKFRVLASQDSWANARDVKELAKKIFHKFDLSARVLILTEAMIHATLDDMIAERGERMSNTKTSMEDEIAAALANAPTLNAPITQTSTSMTVKEEDGKDEAEDDPDDTGTAVQAGIRDAGVSDAVWEQLQKDKEKEVQDDEEFRRLKKAQQIARDADREKIVRQIIAEEEKRKRMAAQKAKLEALGICPAGFAWVRQDGGYRCTAGGHWVSNDEVNKM